MHPEDKEEDLELNEKIEAKLIRKANLKQEVYAHTVAAFDLLKEVLHEASSEINDDLEDRLRKGVRIEYRDRGKFEAQLQVAGDILLFAMHTNVFAFNREHIIWRNAYVKNEPDNAYCGIVNIYNFLADSFKYNRGDDEGYLVGRIFINRENHYFVEGKRQMTLKHNKFGSRTLDRSALISILESTLNYVLDFDLLVPPYDAVKTLAVEQVNTKAEHAKIQIGKRLGYKFNSDDI